jgi:hypothetical protein
MDGRVVGGIAAGVVGLGAAAGIHMVLRDSRERRNDAGLAEWEAWKRELDVEFPKVGSGEGRSQRPLMGDADEQRFVEFLDQHPAPSWIKVKHDDLRAISIDPFEANPKGHDWKAFAALGAGLGGGMATAVTGAMMQERAVAGGTKLGVALNVFGAVLSLGSIAGLFFLPKDTVADRIEASEWHVPSDWRD